MNCNLLKMGMYLLMFATPIVLLQVESSLAICVLAIYVVLLLVVTSKKNKSFLITILLFSIGFWGYLLTIYHIDFNFQSKELSILLNRLSLLFILVPFIIVSFLKKERISLYWNKPDWNEYIYFPFIWSGFHKIKVKYFLVIAISINLSVFIPFMFQNGLENIERVILLSVVFALSNAILEELIWRGVLLVQFSKQFGEKWAVIITSIGFGLQHYSLGFSWIICILFGIGGLFYGGVTVKSKSIIPAIIWHVIMNILMVLSGILFR